jgi:hypothetical protein
MWLRRARECELSGLLTKRDTGKARRKGGKEERQGEEMLWQRNVRKDVLESNQ